MIQQPVYYPFSEVIEDNGRKIIDNTLYLVKTGSIIWILKILKKGGGKSGKTLYFLCSPHNPVGRVMDKRRADSACEICERLDIIVVSDEIHQDFVFKGEHQLFAAINEKLKNRTITCTAPRKTLNGAGLQISNIFISNPELKA